VKSGHISCPRQFSFEAYLRERLGHIVVCVVEVDRNIWLMTLDGLERDVNALTLRVPVGMAYRRQIQKNLERGSRSNL
jgi:hypothetical protein